MSPVFYHVDYVQEWVNCTEGVLMKITAILCISLFLHVGSASAIAPPEADKSPGSQPADEQPATMPWSPTPPSDEHKVMPITRAKTVEDALAYSDKEKIALVDVNDGDGQLDTSALYIMLRHAEMLPAGNKTLEEAERPNPKDFWREPKRYRGRLVRVSVRYGGRVEPWWGRRNVWMVDVLVESEKTKPPTYERMLVVMGHKPPEKLLDRQRLELVGIFYKLVRLSEEAETGDPNKKNDYPVIVASALFTPQSGRHGFPWLATPMIIAVMVLLFVYMRLRRSVSLRHAADRREYKPMRSEDSTAGARAEPIEEVDEELRKQVEAYRTSKKDQRCR